MKKIKRRHIVVCMLVMLYVFVLGKSFYIMKDRLDSVNCMLFNMGDVIKDGFEMM